VIRTFEYIMQPADSATNPAGIIGPPGPGWVEGSIPTFTQSTQPDHPGPYVWWDTSGPYLQLYIEDGE